MPASLIDSPDEHHWVLLDHRVTQLVFEAQALRFESWSLDGSTEVRLTGPFTLRQPGGAERLLDPGETPTLAPMLALLRRRLTSLTIARDGELVADFDGGLAIVAPPSPRTDAWEVQGGGALEGLSYRCLTGGMVEAG
jgi:hypothetical protein